MWQTCHLDPMLDDSVSFVRRLRQLGRVAHLDVLDGLPHGFLNFVLVSAEAKAGSELCIRRLQQIFNSQHHHQQQQQQAHSSSSDDWSFTFTLGFSLLFNDINSFALFIYFLHILCLIWSNWYMLNVAGLALVQVWSRELTEDECTQSVMGSN